MQHARQLAQLKSHAIDVVLSSAAALDARSSLRNHLLDEQPVSLVGRVRSKMKIKFPDELRTEPLLLPGLESIRVTLDRILERAGISPIILAEVDDMAMLRLLAREGDGLALVRSIVVRDELDSRILVEHCRIPDLSDKVYSIVQKRRFPNRLRVDLVEMTR